MDAAFWHSKWDANQIGFHRPDVHPQLTKHWTSLGIKPGDVVLVPLCGKSQDMLWLAEQGFRVIGIELSPVAARDFFGEAGLQATVEQHDRYSTYRGQDITIYCGDFFDFLAADIGTVDAVYDRAALIALPGDQRGAYREQLERLAPQAPIVLITLTYVQSVMSGPPFSVEEAEVRSLFSHRERVEKLDQQDVLSEEPKFAERGLKTLAEVTYRIV